MNTTEIITFVGFATLIIATQVARTVVLAGRALMVDGPLPLRSAAR